MIFTPKELMSENQKSNLQYALVTLGAVFFTWELHEFFHWLTGEILGNDMVMSLNRSYVASGKYLANWHEHVVSVAGPLITLVEAVVAFFLLKNGKTIFLFPFLLSCLYMRALAGLMNIVNPNDEGRLSQALGTDVFFISLLIVGVLLFFVYRIVKYRAVSTRLIVTTVVWILLFSSTMILGDQIFHVVILH
jgi:hypothetical protein